MRLAYAEVSMSTTLTRQISASVLGGLIRTSPFLPMAFDFQVYGAHGYSVEAPRSRFAANFLQNRRSPREFSEKRLEANIHGNSIFVDGALLMPFKSFPRR
jgi:hypothetical protein